ncbi:hypothetical protein G7Y89_g9458 [Cudoniella acicularis]|uniref:Uncharacterized protein n=1 Tax=Cudoniella acicularis TaxID=354080 RepID=A0A8H4VZL9_9HELO|nr:hypothetical protein G7Y89_g9458 [Cudoniella acicularis]
MFCYTILRDSSLGLRLLTIIAFRESYADRQSGQKWRLNFAGCVILPLDESLKFPNPWVTGVIIPKMTNLLRPRVASVETTIDIYVVSELPSLLLGRAWIQEVRLLRGVRNHIYYIRGPLGNLIKLPNPISTTEADTDSVTGEYETALVAEELLTAAEARECELGESGDETISEDEVWKDTVSRQSIEDDLYSVDHLTEKVITLKKRLDELDDVFDVIRQSLTGGKHSKQRRLVRVEAPSGRPD